MSESVSGRGGRRIAGGCNNGPNDDGGGSARGGGAGLGSWVELPPEARPPTQEMVVARQDTLGLLPARRDGSCPRLLQFVKICCAIFRSNQNFVPDNVFS